MNNLKTNGSRSRSLRRATDLSTSRNESGIRLRNILAPIDFSAESRKAVHYAVALAKEFGAAITLLHVVDPIVFEADYGYGPVTRQVSDKERVRRAKTKLRALARHAIDGRFLAETLVETGTACSEITKAANALDTDLIVLGTHGHTGWARAMLGSTAEKVVRHAPCPVLVVRRKEHDFIL